MQPQPKKAPTENIPSPTNSCDRSTDTAFHSTDSKSNGTNYFDADFDGVDAMDDETTEKDGTVYLDLEQWWVKKGKDDKVHGTKKGTKRSTCLSFFFVHGRLVPLQQKCKAVHHL